MEKRRIYIGCCGFCMSQHKYFDNFSAVEIQRTFYQLPQISTAEKWRNSAPAGFIFTMKAWQGVTHPVSSPTYRKVRLSLPEEKRQLLGFFQPTDEVFRAWDATSEFALTLGAKIVILQTPPRFVQNDTNERNIFNFFHTIKKPSFRIAVEFRANWEKSVINHLCEKYDLIHCIDPFAGELAFLRDTLYLRLHGCPPGEKMYHYKYSLKDFKHLQNFIAEKATENVQSIYVFFNNMFMADDAIQFTKFSCEQSKNQ